MLGDYEWFVEEFRRHAGVDLSSYKRLQMERRLTALRDKRGYVNFETYLDAVKNDRQLFDELLDRLTINISEFFRNQSRWDVLSKELLPHIGKQGTIKAWSAACSTGEEPYTLMILLARLFSLEKVSVWATDIDARALEQAQAGVYSQDALVGVPTDERMRYFATNDAGTACISSELRSRVTFARQDLLRDSFPTGFDLIVCRNVLIYFTEPAKDLLYHKFAGALRRGGVLFVGSTEQIFRAQSYGLQQIQPFFYERL